MKLKFDFTNMDSSILGGEGIDLSDSKKEIDKIENALKGAIQKTDSYLPDVKEDEINEILSYAYGVRKSADSFVILGIGGSALGSLSACHALLHNRHNCLTKKHRGNVPKLFIEDNIDPERIAALFDSIKIKKSYFNFITKSGETIETLSQFLIIYDILKRILGEKKARERVIITTTIEKGSLYDFAKKEGFKIFSVPKRLGGRYSFFSSVGLFPLAVMGINIRMLLKGALEFFSESQNADLDTNPALKSAYLQYKSVQKGKNISVMMPYADSLKYMADYYCQLWAESLGKELDNNSNKVNVGQTPVKALGTTDQHSQIQLYCEGPFDKVVTFISVEEFRDSIFIPDDSAVTDFAFLKSKNLADILNASCKSASIALTKKQRLNFTITLPCICEYTIGGLMMYFMLETVFMAELLNVNAFNQPGVEDGKIETLNLIRQRRM